ncbi:MAG: SRPBCC family protein [Actinomycetota bacterium]
MGGTTTYTAHVDRSPEQVFALLSDIDRHSEWSVKTFRSEKRGDGPVGVGTVYETHGWLPGQGKDHENTVTITAFEPGKRFAFDAKDPRGPVIPSDFVLTAEGGGTRVDRTMTFPKPPGFQGFMWPVIFPMLVKPAIQKNLNMFKAKAEEQPAAG